MSIFDEMTEGIFTRSTEETMALAERLALALPADATVTLQGPLGAGKTTFVKGLARGLGIQDMVTSPTFNLYHLYRGSRLLLHLDAYRLTSAAEAEALLLEEFLASPWCMAVEWPEHIREFLPEPRWELILGHAEGELEAHTIKLKTPA